MKTVAFRKLLAPVVCALAFVAKPSFALDVSFGNLTDSSIAQAYTYTPGASIHDIFRFDLSAPSSFNAVIAQITLLNFFNIDNFSVGLSQGNGPTTYFPATGATVLTGTQLLPMGNDYALTVSGMANGTLGGGYSLLMAAANFSPPPVPEPDEWILLLGGLGMLLLIARRHRNVTALA